MICELSGDSTIYAVDRCTFSSKDIIDIDMYQTKTKQPNAIGGRSRDALYIWAGYTQFVCVTPVMTE